jgi:hypothetical protein
LETPLKDIRNYTESEIGRIHKQGNSLSLGEIGYNDDYRRLKLEIMKQKLGIANKLQNWQSKQQNKKI